MELDEQALIRRCRDGDEEAFRMLMERHQRGVFAVAQAMVRDAEEARDIVQEAFVRVFQGLGAFKGDASFKTWLQRIVRNLCIDRLRARKSREQALGEVETVSEGEDAVEAGLVASRWGSQPQDRLLDRELGEAIHAAVARLPEKHREILVLREVEGMSYEELAEALGIPKGTVMSRLFHARSKLQKDLAEFREGGVAAAAGGQK